MNMKQMAKYVSDQSKTKKIAAFVIDGRIRTMTLDEKRFSKIMKDYEHRCLGVYYCAPEEWVYDDIVSVSGRSLQ